MTQFVKENWHFLVTALSLGAVGGFAYWADTAFPDCEEKDL